MIDMRNTASEICEESFRSACRPACNSAYTPVNDHAILGEIGIATLKMRNKKSLLVKVYFVIHN